MKAVSKTEYTDERIEVTLHSDKPILIANVAVWDGQLRPLAGHWNSKIKQNSKNQVVIEMNAAPPAESSLRITLTVANDD